MTNGKKEESNFKSYIIRIFIILFTLYLLVFSVVWALSPIIIKRQVNELLNTYQLSLSDSSHIQLNPFIARMSIDDFQLLNRQQEVAMSISTGAVDINLIALISKQIEFDELLLDGAFVSIIEKSGELNVAGIPISNNSNAQPNEPKQTVSPNNWEINVERPVFKNIKLDIHKDKISHPIMIKQLNLPELKMTANNQLMTVDSQVQFHDSFATVAANLTFNEAIGNVAFDIKVLQLDLTTLSEHFGELGQIKSGLLSVNILGDIAIDDEGIKLSATNPSFSITNLDFQHSDFAISMSLVEFLANELSFIYSKNGVAFTSKLNASVEGFNLAQQDTKHIIASAEVIAVNDVDVSVNSEDTTIGIADFSASKLIFSDLKREAPINGKEFRLATTEQLSIHNVLYSKNVINVEQVKLDSLGVNVFINKMGKIENLVNFNSSSLDVDEGANADDSTTEQIIKGEISYEKPAEFYVKLDNFIVSKDSQLYLHDESVLPIFEETVKFNKVIIEKVNSQKKGGVSNVSIDATLGGHTQLLVTSDLQLFAPKLNFKAEMTLSEFSLPTVSSYMGKALGLDFLSGQLDTNLNITVKDDVIDGETVIKLRGMSLSGAGHEQGDLVKDTGTVPLNVALNMLKDDDDNVRLKIPLSGDINSPSFGIKSFIGLVTKKAILSATESYLMQTFIPYSNIVSVAKIAGEYMLRVKIDDLIYEPEQVIVSNNQARFVSELVTLLKDKKDKQLKVCAISSPIDSGQVQALSEGSKGQLIKIAAERGKLFKQKLVDDFDIKSNRLLLCKPKIDTDINAKPRIELSF